MTATDWDVGASNEGEPPWGRADEPVDGEEDRFKAYRDHQSRVEKELNRLRANDEARRLFARQQRADMPRPRFQRLDEFLAQPYDDPTYRVSRLLPTGGRVMLEAQFKAGKTTLIGNLLRALVDGDPFLGRFDVTPGAHVALIDNELDQRTLQWWLADQRIQNTSAIRLVPLRGQLGTFDIRDPDVRAEWAADIRGADVVILDCLRPVLDALGLDENHEAGQFLVPFDALLLEAGASEAVVVHHMGHGAERARGDSRLKDWPDASWKLVRDKDEDDPTIDDPSGARYFSAFGRDVDHPQAELMYDPNTRHLTLSAEARNRVQATEERKITKARDGVMAAVGAKPGISSSDLRDEVRERCGIKHNPAIDRARTLLVDEGLLMVVKSGRTHMHYVAGTNPQASLPTMPNDAQPPLGNVPNAPIGHGHTQHPHDDAQPGGSGHREETP